MEIKPFSEFLDSLSEEDIKYMVAEEDEYNNLSEKFAESNGTVKAYQYLLSHCYGMNLRVLERYHRWLFETQNK